MPWHDMQLDRRVTVDEVRNAVSHVYGVQTEQVTVVVSQEYPDHSNLPPETHMLCWMSEQPGDFPIRLEIMAWKEELLPLVSDENEGRLCELFNCRALVSSEERNPYSWILISDRTHMQKVIVDGDILDSDPSGFVIESYVD